MKPCRVPLTPRPSHPTLSPYVKALLFGFVLGAILVGTLYACGYLFG